MTDTLYNELLTKHLGDLTVCESRQRLQIDEYLLDLATILYATVAWSFWTARTMSLATAKTSVKPRSSRGLVR